MLRLRLRPEAVGLSVSLTTTAARAFSVAGVTMSSNNVSLTASLPVATANPTTLSMLRRVSGRSYINTNNSLYNNNNNRSASVCIPYEQFRFVRASKTSSTSASEGNDHQQQTSASSSEQQQQQAADEKANTSNENNNNENKEGGAEGEDASKAKAKAAPKSKTLREQFQALRQDMIDFPDIYNSVNLVHFFIFTIFCLCSTGSNVELQWWMNNWGIDKTFAPWAWPLHSLLTNNFLSMTFAMLLLHSMCHSAMTTLGPRLMWQYMGIVACVSGALMWGLNSTMGWSHEKQFGPWDVCSALFVMQYLHQGMKPWQLILSFNGWVKYAMCVGSVVILYYDWQPVMFGTGLGFALCKLHPKLRGIKPPSS